MSNNMHDDYSPESAQAQAMQEMQAELVAAKLDAWREKAVQQHPGAMPMKDYLVANSEEDVVSLAADIASKMGGQQQTTRPASPPVPGGTPALYNQTEDEQMDELRDAVKHRPTNEAWTDLLRAKFNRSGLGYPPDQQ